MRSIAAAESGISGNQIVFRKSNKVESQVEILNTTITLITKVTKEIGRRVLFY